MHIFYLNVDYFNADANSQFVLDGLVAEDSFDIQDMFKAIRMPTGSNELKAKTFTRADLAHA